MKNPFSEVKDTKFLKWLWANGKVQVAFAVIIGILFMTIPPLLTDGIIANVSVVVGFFWLAAVGGVIPFVDYTDKRANYKAFEESINKEEYIYATNETVSAVMIGIPPTRDNFKRIILAGAAGSGKDYLRDKLEERGFPVDISVTTRPMRDGEIPGETYHYIGVDHFKQLENRGKLYESVEFNGAHYGTLRQTWENSLIFIMTPSGIEHITESDREDCVIVYLNIEEKVRRERMSKRSDNGFDKIERRVKADNEDFKDFLPEVNIVITDPLFDAESTIQDILDMAQLDKK